VTDVQRLIAALLFALAAGSPLHAQSTFTISGLVVSNGPVGGVKVNFFVFDLPTNQTIADFNVITGSDGRFSASVPAGRLHLRVEPPPESGLAAEHLLNIDLERDLSLAIPLVEEVRISGRWVPPPGVEARSRIEAVNLEPGRGTGISTPRRGWWSQSASTSMRVSRSRTSSSRAQVIGHCHRKSRRFSLSFVPPHRTPRGSPR
jgi:hypothetical protein